MLENELFLVQANDIVDRHLHDERFGVSQLARLMSMSRTSLYRKFKKYTNQTVSHFICEKRLNKSIEYLNRGDLTISEIAYKVGFSSVSYFIKCFHLRYGYSPGEIRKMNHGETSIEKAPNLSARGTILLIPALAIFSLILLILALLMLFN